MDQLTSFEQHLEKYRGFPQKSFLENCFVKKIGGRW